MIIGLPTINVEAPFSIACFGVVTRFWSAKFLLSSLIPGVIIMNSCGQIDLINLASRAELTIPSSLNLMAIFTVF